MKLNGGRKSDALIRLSELLGNHVDTVRRWVNGRREIPQADALAIRLMVENQEIRRKLNAVAIALGANAGVSTNDGNSPEIPGNVFVHKF